LFHHSSLILDPFSGGWLELPDMTILEVCGPWYSDQEIPSEIFTNPDQGANLNSRWVRKK
jgi:hypothetical protein